MIVLFLTGMIAMIMMRTLHRDLMRYNEMDESEESQQEETGWKLIYSEVFRPPQNGGFFSVLIGSGVQVFSMALLTLVFALLGFLSPANRGGLMTALLLLFVFMGWVDFVCMDCISRVTAFGCAECLPATSPLGSTRCSS